METFAALSVKRETAAPPAGVAVPFIFWPAVFGGLAFSIWGEGFDTNLTLAAAAVLMLCVGLPHGAYDLAVASRAFSLGKKSASLIFTIYILTSFLVLALWSLDSALALVLFLTLSAIHFGDDWRMLESALLRFLAGASIVCIPTFFQTESVLILFSALAQNEVRWVGALLVAATPVAILVTIAGMKISWERGNKAWVCAQTASLIGLALLPPQIGFLLYFGFLHSPLHMREVVLLLPTWSKKRFWSYGTIICLGCLVVAALLLPNLISGQSREMSAEAFRLLSMLSAPHLVLTLVMRYDSSRRTILGYFSK